MDYKILSVIIGLEAMRRGANSLTSSDVAKRIVDEMTWYNDFYDNEPDLHRVLLIIDEELNKRGMIRK